MTAHCIKMGWHPGVTEGETCPMPDDFERKTVQPTTDIPCTKCAGSGCAECDGWGYTTVEACLACLGTGKEDGDKCGACHGSGYRAID